MMMKHEEKKQLSEVKCSLRVPPRFLPKRSRHNYGESRRRFSAKVVRYNRHEHFSIHN